MTEIATEKTHLLKNEHKGDVSSQEIMLSDVSIDQETPDKKDHKHMSNTNLNGKTTMTDKNEERCKCISIVVICIPIVVVFLLLIVAYAISLGGTVTFHHKDHTPCQLSVDEVSGGRITDLINRNNVKLFYLNLTFPSNVNVSKTDNIFKETSMVWTFRNNAEERQFLDFPMLYLVWSFGLLEQQTYRNEKLAFVTDDNRNCSLILGTEETTLAIIKALRNLTLAIANDDSKQEKETKSVWCQTYKKEGIPESTLNFARYFRFYFTDLRYRCCHLESNITSKEFQEVCDKTFRPFPKYWSFLAFLFSLLSVWFLPFMFKFVSEGESCDKEFVYYGTHSPLTFTEIILIFARTVVRSCERCFSLTSCPTRCKIFLKYIFYFGLIFPSCTYIMYIIFKINPDGAAILSDYNNHGYLLALSESELFRVNSGSWISFGAVLFILYITTSFICVPFSIYSYHKYKIALTPSETESIEEKQTYDRTQKSKTEQNYQGLDCSKLLFLLFPLLFIFYRVQRNIIQMIDTYIGVPFILIVCIVFVLNYIWFFTIIVIAYKSCMYIFLFFSFGILSILAYPDTQSIFIYIFAGVSYTLKCLFNPGHQYSRFLKLIIDVMENDDELKKEIKTDNPNGDIMIERELFMKLVERHLPITNMVFWVFLKIVFVLAVLTWAGKSVLEVGQWKALGIIEEAVIAFILTKIPYGISVVFVEHNDDVLKRRLKNDIQSYYKSTLRSQQWYSCG